MKTIKQIAYEIGVSKQAIYKRINREPLSTKLSTELSTVDGRLTVSVDGEKLIKQAFLQIPVNQSCQPVENVSTKNEEIVENVSTKVDNLTTAVDSEIMDILKKNINILQQQLEIKDKQIEELSSALILAQQTAAAAQALHAGTMNHLAISDEKKPGILSRLFNRG